MEKSVQCNYCNGAVATHNALSCHQVCSLCFLYLCLFNKDTLLKKNKKGGKITFKCLKCDTGMLITTKQKVHQICSETKTSDTEKKPPCPTHKKEQDVYCGGSKAFMCPKCFDAHKDFPAFFNHQSTTEPVSNSCPKHKNQALKFQCLKCETPICDFCTKKDHKDHSIDLIEEFYEPKMKEINANFKLMPFKKFEEYDDCLLIEHDQLQRTITQQSKLLKNKVQSKENLINYAKKLEEEEATLDYEITRIIYKQFFLKFQTLSPEDYFHISTLSQLPYKLHHLSQTNQQVNEALTQRIRNYDEMENVKTLTGHTFVVLCLIQLQDGKIASGSHDGTIKVWNPNDDYNCMKTLTGHYNGVKYLIQLQNGLIVSGSNDYTIKVWNPKDDYNCIKTLTEHNHYVTCLIQLQDGLIFSGSADRTIKIWNPKDDYNCIKTLTGHNEGVTCLFQLQDGKIVSGSFDYTIKVWNPNDDYHCIKTLTGHNEDVRCLIQLQDGKIASGSFDSTIKVWNPKDDYNCIKTLTCNGDWVYCLIQLQDGLIVSGSSDSTIKVWNPNDDYNCIKTLTGHDDVIYCLIQLQDGLIVSGSRDKTIKVWNPKDDVSIPEKKEKNCLIQ